MMNSLGRLFSCCFGAPAERPREALLEGLRDDSTPLLDARIAGLVQHLHALHEAPDETVCQGLIDAAADLRELSREALQIQPPAHHGAAYRAKLQLAHGRRFLTEGRFDKALLHFNHAKNLGAWQAGLAGLQRASRTPRVPPRLDGSNPGRSWPRSTLRSSRCPCRVWPQAWALTPSPDF